MNNYLKNMRFLHNLIKLIYALKVSGEVCFQQNLTVDDSDNFTA